MDISREADAPPVVGTPTIFYFPSLSPLSSWSKFFFFFFPHSILSATFFLLLPVVLSISLAAICKESMDTAKIIIRPREPSVVRPHVLKKKWGPYSFFWRSLLACCPLFFDDLWSNYRWMPTLEFILLIMASIWKFFIIWSLVNEGLLHFLLPPKCQSFDE